MNKKIPVDIILVTYKRLHLLKKTVDSIYRYTNYPYRLWVVNNGTDDNNTIQWLTGAKLHGYIYDFITLPDNIGLAGGLTAGFEHIKKAKRERDRGKYIVATEDDIICPRLTPCWLGRLVHLQEKHPDQGAIALRIERTRHRDINEEKEIIPSSTVCPAVFRITKRELIEKMNGFGYSKHWEGNSFSKRMKEIGQPRMAMATHIYASHSGFISNKGFAEGVIDYFTYAKNKKTQHTDQPYPEIDTKTLIPLKTNTPRDDKEQQKRSKYYESYGVDDRKINNLTLEQKELLLYTEKGIGLDLGVGRVKIGKNSIGMDIYPFPCVDIIGEVDDLWMFGNNELDFIVNSHLLEHLKDPIAAMQEWNRVLKIGGTMAIAVPNGDIAKFILRSGHRSNISLETLRLMMKFRVGLKIIRCELLSNSKGKDRVAIVVGVKR